jgi:hypothetical protein
LVQIKKENDEISQSLDSKDKKIQEITEKLKSLVQDLAPILQQQRKIDPNLCIVKTFQNKVQEGGEGYFIIEGRNNTRAISFSKQDQITAEFYQKKKGVLEKVDIQTNLTINGSLAKLTFKLIDGTYNVTLFVNSQLLGNNGKGYEVSVEKREPDSTKSKAYGCCWNVGMVGKLSKFNYCLVDQKGQVMETDDLECFLTSPEDEVVLQLKKEKITNGCSFSFVPKELNEVWFNYSLMYKKKEFFVQQNVLIANGTRIEKETEKAKKRCEAIQLKMNDKGAMGMEKDQADKIKKQEEKLKDYETLISKYIKKDVKN